MRKPDWHKYVDYAVFAHNTNYNPTTRSTPSDLFHGFAPNKALEVRFQVPHKKQPEFQTTQQIQDKLKELFYPQKDDIIQRYVKYKQYYDKQAQAYPLKIHTYCLLLNPKLDTQKQSMNKMLPKWLALYRIEKKMSHENYLIRETGTNHTQIVHRIRLRSYTPKHNIQDLENIDQKNFIPDPNCEDDYKQPAIIDKAQQKLLWHLTLSDTPETDYIPQPPTTYDTLFVRKPIINLKRLPNNTIGTTRRVIRPPQPATQPKLVVAPQNTNIQRVLQPTTSTTQKGPFQVKVPQPSTSANTSKPATIKATTKRVIAAKLPKLFLQKAKHKMGEKTLKAAMLCCHSQTDPITGELPTIPENQDQIQTHNTITIQNFPVIKWEDLPHPNWDKYEPDQQHLLMQLKTTQPTQSPYMAQNLIWHWCPLPIDEPLPEKDIIVKLTTKEKFHKYNQTKSSKEGSTHTGTPEIGDARRFFERGSNRYITALIISSKITPTELDNLKLAFWNLHCQAETLNATNIHIQLANKAFRPVATMEGILALENSLKLLIYTYTGGYHTVNSDSDQINTTTL